MFVKFPSLEGLDRLAARQRYAADNDPGSYEPVVKLRPKPKIHGMNAAFCANSEAFWAQGKNELLTHEHDGGFHDAMMAHAERLMRKIAARENHALDAAASGKTLCVFGEWAGSGVQKKDAVTMIRRTLFFPFLIAVVPDDAWQLSDVRQFRKRVTVTTSFGEIKSLLSDLSDDVFVLPWMSKTRSLDFSSPDDLDVSVREINESAEAMGVQDAYIRETFGVTGPGEGLVFVPCCELRDGVTLDDYANLSFKAKAERHRVKISDKAAKITEDLPSSVHEFVRVFATDNRMEQMLNDQLDGDLSKGRTGEFVAAVIRDVLKESGPEREQLGASEKTISALVGRRAAGWFLEKIMSNVSSPSP